LGITYADSFWSSDDALTADGGISASSFFFNADAHFENAARRIRKGTDVTFRLEYVKEDSPLTASDDDLAGALTQTATDFWKNGGFFLHFGDLVQCGYIPYQSLDLQCTYHFDSESDARSFGARLNATILGQSGSAHVAGSDVSTASHHTANLAFATKGFNPSADDMIALLNLEKELQNGQDMRPDLQKIFAHLNGVGTATKPIYKSWVSVMQNPPRDKVPFAASGVDLAAAEFTDLDTEFDNLQRLADGVVVDNTWLSRKEIDGLRGLVRDKKKENELLKVQWRNYLQGTLESPPDTPKQDWSIPRIEVIVSAYDRDDFTDRYSDGNAPVGVKVLNVVGFHPDGSSSSIPYTKFSEVQLLMPDGRVVGDYPVKVQQYGVYLNKPRQGDHDEEHGRFGVTGDRTLWPATFRQFDLRIRLLGKSLKPMYDAPVLPSLP
jgi:hypothetical protein